MSQLPPAGPAGLALTTVNKAGRWFALEGRTEG